MHTALHRHDFDHIPPQAAIPPLLRGVRSICASLDLTGSEVIKIAAVTAGSEVYEISRESGAAMLLHVSSGICSSPFWRAETEAVVLGVKSSLCTVFPVAP